MVLHAGGEHPPSGACVSVRWIVLVNSGVEMLNKRLDAMTACVSHAPGNLSRIG